MSPYPMSQFPRFGYGSDFAKLASSEEEEQADYVLGILAVSYFIMSLFIFWSVMIIVFKCMGTQRVGLCSGRIHVDCDEKGRFIKQPTNVWKIRMAFIIAGCWMFLCCTALIGPGLQSIKNTSVSILKLNQNTNDVATQGMLILDQVQRAKWNIDELDVQSKTCPKSKSVIKIDAKFDQLEEVIQEVDFEEIRQHIDIVMNGNMLIEAAVNVVEEYDWIIKMFTLVLGVLTFFMIFASCSAWGGMYRYLFALTDMMDLFILPLFVLAIMCCWIVSSALAFAGISNAGDSQQHGLAGTLTNIFEERGITNDHMIYEAFTYYHSGCVTDDPIDQLHQYEDYLQSGIRLADKFLVKANQIGIDELNDQCGADVTPIIEGIGIINDNLGLLLDALRSTFDLASCSKIGSLYTQVFDGTVCTDSSGSFAVLFLIMFAISFLGMIMIMLRSAMFPIQKLFPPMPLDEKDDELKDYQTYIQYSTGLVMWSSKFDDALYSKVATRETSFDDSTTSTNLSFEVARIEAMVSEMESVSSPLSANVYEADVETRFPSAPPESPAPFNAEDEDDKENNMPLSTTLSTNSKLSNIYTFDVNGDDDDELLPLTPRSPGMRSRRPVTPSFLTPGTFTRWRQNDKEDLTGQHQGTNYSSSVLLPLKLGPTFDKKNDNKRTNPKAE